jgi:uncharacterized protein (TIGR04255 family)
MRPYPGWLAVVMPKALKMLGVCQQGLEAFRLTELSVRYVDEISLPPGRDISDYFTILPIWPEQEGQETSGFDMQIRRRYPQQHAKAQVRFMSLPNRPAGFQPFLVDVAVVRQDTDKPLEFAALGQHLDELHAVQRAIFESLITDDLRQLLGATP